MNQIADAAPRHALLAAIGDRVRTLRARRGMTRKALAREAQVSERHLANLETGSGNVSVLLLRQLAQALDSTVAELADDGAAASPEWLQIRELLRGRSAEALRDAREMLAARFGGDSRDPSRSGRIALLGLRGAGKSTLGRMLADDLGRPFIELNAAIERLAGCSVAEVHALYGASAYRRYELRALEETIAAHAQAVIAMPGGIVAEPAAFALLRDRCCTVWLHATPEDHMRRVLAQGDLRPMSGHREAMEDLKRILAARADFYARADIAFDTSGASLADAYVALRAAVTAHLATEPERRHG